MKDDTATHSVKVLLVEDNPTDARLLLADLANVQGGTFEVTVAQRLSDAVDQLKKQSFDIGLLDLSLPDSSGMETVERFRRGFPSMPVVVLTGVEDEKTGLEAVRLGVQDYLVKGRCDGTLISRAIRYAVERKRMEEELRVSQEKYRAIVETSHEGIVLASLDGEFYFVNQRMADMLGYSREELVGKNSLGIIDEASEETARKTRDVLAGGESVQSEYRLRKKDGTLLWSLVSAAPIFDDKGNHVGNLGMHSDITSRKRTEEDLKQLLEVTRTAREQLGADLDAMTRLQKLGSLPPDQKNIQALYNEIVEAAVAISGADFGTMQLLDSGSQTLRIAASRGFPQWWLDYWNSVSENQGSCGAALKNRSRIIVENVAQSPVFADAPSLDIQRKAGVGAVQSTPLITRSGEFLGVISTHYKAPQKPSERALRLLDLLPARPPTISKRRGRKKRFAPPTMTFPAPKTNG